MGDRGCAGDPEMTDGSLGIVLALSLAVAGGGEPVRDYTKTTDNRDKTITVGANGESWEKTPEHGRQPKGQEPAQEKYLRGDEAVCVLTDLDDMVVDIVNQM